MLSAVVAVSGCTQSSTGQTTGSSQEPTKTTPTVPTLKCRDIQVPYEGQEEYLKTEYYTESVQYTDKECDTKPLIYSIENFALDLSVCNNQEEVCHESYPILGCVKKTVYCVDRTVSCSFTLNNLDDERGTWGIDFKFLKPGSNSIVTTTSISRWLYPKTSGTITGIGRITLRELKDTDYTCSYVVSNEATKQICRDVIKYKDVQKTRQVTAYKPVTKYRTEQRCE